MKKVLMFASAAIAALAMVSCNKEIEIQDKPDTGCPDGYYVEELVAEYPRDPETRTAFNENTGKFAWTEGDELAFHLSNGTYTSAPIDPATSKVKLYLPVGVTRDNYAVYPASAVVDEAAEIGNMQVTLPSTYDISGNLTTDYVPMPLIATNDADNKKLKFEHVGGLLQVNLNVPAGVKTARISMGKTITGTFSLVEGSGNGIIAPGEDSNDEVTYLLSQAGLSSDTEVKLLLPIPTGTYDYFQLVYNDGFDDTFRFAKDLSANTWDFTRSGGKKVSINESSFEDITPDYFWFDALQSSCTVIVRKGQTSGFFYSVDNKHTWIPIESDSSVSISLRKKGDRVYFYGTAGDVPKPDSNTGIFGGYGKLAAGGDILTLLKKNGAEMPTSAFYGLFYGNNALIDASAIVLPDYTVPCCYEDMFFYCQNLTETPVLPAMKVATGGYRGMFGQCRSLTVAPELPALEVGLQGYMDMFEISGLIEAPELPAPSEGLSSGCYLNMFWHCTSLIKASDLNISSIPSEACVGMYSGCTSLTIPPFIAASNVSLGGLSDMFMGCTSLELLPEMPNLSNLERRACANMFKGCTSLVDLSEYVLTATTLGEEAYDSMFKDCSSLTKGPQINASSFGLRSCRYMFSNCTSLVQASELPRTSLGTQCYVSMFSGCSSLEVAPELPATSLPMWCYMKMFQGCVSLKQIPDLPAMRLSGSCYEQMFEGCESLTEVYLPATANSSSCKGMFKNCNALEKVELFIAGDKEMFSGCSNLSTIITHFKSWGTSDNWVSSISETGNFYKVSDLPCSIDENGVAIDGDYSGTNRIPLGWNVYNLEEVGAGI